VASTWLRIASFFALDEGFLEGGVAQVASEPLDVEPGGGRDLGELRRLVAVEVPVHLEQEFEEPRVSSIMVNGWFFSIVVLAAPHVLVLERQRPGDRRGRRLALEPLAEDSLDVLAVRRSRRGRRQGAGAGGLQVASESTLK